MIQPFASHSRRRAVVVGAGAMGSIFGAALQDGGNEVWFIDANRTLTDHLQANDLIIDRRDGTTDRYRIPATSAAGALGFHADLVLFQVKGFATAAAVELVRPVVGPLTSILTLQNGLGNEDVLRAAFPDNPILIGNSVHSVAVVGLGHVSHTGVRQTSIGPADDQWADAAGIAAHALEGSGFEVRALDERAIRHEIWAKFVMNCGSLPTFALTGLSTSDVNGYEVVLALSDELVRETCVIAEAEGIDLDPEERVGFSRELFRTAGGKASMLQDLESGRKTEIDTINGAAIRYADRHGLAAPLNRAMFALVKGREAAMGIRS